MSEPFAGPLTRILMIHVTYHMWNLYAIHFYGYHNINALRRSTPYHYNSTLHVEGYHLSRVLQQGFVSLLRKTRVLVGQ